MRVLLRRTEPLVPGPVHRAVSAALLAACLLGCGAHPDTEPPPDRVLTRSLASRAHGAGAPLSWRKFAGRQQRLFTCEQSCRLQLELPDEVASGEALLLETGLWAPATGAGGSFRIELDGVVLHDAAGRHGLRDKLRIQLPADRAPLARLTLDARLAGDGSRALWFDPLLEWRIERERQAPEGSWNLLLVSSDTTRLDALSAYGGPAATPGLERLAAEGIRFDDLHSVAFGTLPSHATMFTSQSAREHGAIGNGWVITGGAPTLAEVLQERGYTTAAFVSTRVLEGRLGIGRGFDLYDEPHLDQRRGDLTVSLVESWLERGPVEPFFLFVHLYDPHQPYTPPPPFDALDGVGADVAAVDDLLASIDPKRQGRVVSGRAVLRADRSALPAVEKVARARYHGEIAFVDSQVARLRALLEAHDMFDDTLVVFTADHGENFLERGPAMAFDHAGLHAEVSRLPLLMRFPDGRLAGTVSGQLRSSLDLAPTLASALGVEVPEAWRGSPLLDGNKLDEGEASALVLEASRAREIAVRSKHFFYRALQPSAINNPGLTRDLGYRGGHPEQLYRRQAGASEQRDIIGEEQAALPTLRAHLEHFLRETPQAQTRRLDDEEHIEALKALGYLDSDDAE